MNHEDWCFRGVVLNALQGSPNALEQLLDMLADEQRPLTHEDRLVLSNLIKHLTSKRKRGRRHGKVFSPAWLVRQLAAEARRRHQLGPRRSLEICGEEAVTHWGVAEFSRLTVDHDCEDLIRKLDDLAVRVPKLTSTVLTELRGRGVSGRRRRNRQISR